MLFALRERVGGRPITNEQNKKEGNLRMQPEEEKEDLLEPKRRRSRAQMDGLSL